MPTTSHASPRRSGVRRIRRIAAGGAPAGPAALTAVLVAAAGPAAATSERAVTPSIAAATAASAAAPGGLARGEAARRAGIVSALALADDVAASPSAGDAAAPDLDAELRRARDLDVELVTGAWLARLGGEVILGEGNAPFRIDRTIRNDELEPTPLAELSILDDEGFVAWRLHGFDFSSESSGAATRAFDFGSLAFAAGDPYETRIDFTSAGLEGVIHRWTAIDPAASEGPGLGRGDARLDLSVLGGVRWIAVDQRVTRPGTGTESPDADWLAAYAAARVEFTWAPDGGFVVGERFRITAEYGIGPGLNAGGGSIWQVRAGAELEVTPNLRGFFGYRLLELDLEDGDWTFDSGLQGLFVGATLQF